MDSPGSHSEKYADRKKRLQRTDLAALKDGLFHGNGERMENIMREYRIIQRGTSRSSLRPVDFVHLLFTHLIIPIIFRCHFFLLRERSRAVLLNLLVMIASRDLSLPHRVSQNYFIYYSVFSTLISEKSNSRSIDEDATHPLNEHKNRSASLSRPPPSSFIVIS